MSFIKVCSDWELLDMAEGLRQPTTIEREMTKRFRFFVEKERTRKLSLFLDPQARLREQAEALVQEAKRYGLVLRIETVPLQPLAMGHHEMKVSVDPAHPY